MNKNIEFTSQGATIRGLLLLPDDNTTNCPIVIMAHGFSTSYKMTADKYAEEFRKAGFAVILYDHRNLGTSDGEPRGEVNYAIQARGYIDCMDMAEQMREVDASRMALWGCSSSGRLAYIVSSIDSRPKAIVAQVPALGDQMSSELENEEAFAYNREVILSDDISSLEHVVAGPIAVVSRDQEQMPSFLHHSTAADWFLEFGERPGTGWKNMVTIARVVDPYGFHPAHCVKHVSSSVMFVVADDEEIEGANPGVVKEVFDHIEQPKEWESITGGHFGLLHYPSETFDHVSRKEVEFLKKYL